MVIAMSTIKVYFQLHGTAFVEEKTFENDFEAELWISLNASQFSFLKVTKLIH